MAQLDRSKHSLNTSSSKQKYSFPKTKRFSEQKKNICDSYYQIPSTFSKRSTNLGYGNKSLGISNDKFLPPVGTYNLQADINPQKNKQRSISFGVSREQMQLGGPLGNVKKFLQKLPAPCAYQPKDVSNKRAPALRSRLQDYQLKRYAMNPGPGTYNHEQIGSKNYYLNSRYKNTSVGKMSELSRDKSLKKTNPVGPTDYQQIDSLNASGRYQLDKNPGVKSCVFPKTIRQGPVEKSKVFVPGPGQYRSFSSFG